MNIMLLDGKKKFENLDLAVFDNRKHTIPFVKLHIA